MFLLAVLFYKVANTKKSLEAISEGETVISSESDSLNDIIDMTNNKDEKQFEWLDEKICIHTPDEWSKSIDGNKQFIFILTKVNKILKVDKKNKRSTVIINNENEPEEEIFFLKATEEKLCYVLDGKKHQIYAYSLKGQDKLLISLKANQVWNPYNRSPYVYSYDNDTLYYVYEEDDNSYLCAYTGKNGEIIFD